MSLKTFKSRSSALGLAKMKAELSEYKKLIHAYIKSASGDLIGTINEESTAFRVYWRSRPEQSSVNTHSADTVLHATFEAARQEVFSVYPSAMVEQARH